MPDFFLAPCSQVAGNCKKAGIICKSVTAATIFGLCDDPPPSDLPAYLDLTDSNKWIAQVDNPRGVEVVFKAIDNCVPIFRLNGSMESRCDCMLLHENIMTFVELKDRASSGWIAKGRNQLIITILNFIADNDITIYAKVEAYICNKQKPLTVVNISTELQKFKNETGFILKVDRKISV